MKLSTVVRNYIKTDYELQNKEAELDFINSALDNSSSLTNGEYADLRDDRKVVRKQIEKLQKNIEKIDTLFFGFDPTEEEFDSCVEKTFQVLKLTPADYALENLYYSNWY